MELEKYLYTSAQMNLVNPSSPIWRGNVFWKETSLLDVVISSRSSVDYLENWKLCPEATVRVYIIYPKVAMDTSYLFPQEYCQIFFGQPHQRQSVNVTFPAQLGVSRLFSYVQEGTIRGESPYGLLIVPRFGNYFARPIYADLKWSKIYQGVSNYQVEGLVMTHSNTKNFLEYLFYRGSCNDLWPFIAPSALGSQPPQLSAEGFYPSYFGNVTQPSTSPLSQLPFPYGSFYGRNYEGLFHQPSGSPSNLFFPPEYFMQGNVNKTPSINQPGSIINYESFVKRKEEEDEARYRNSLSNSIRKPLGENKPSTVESSIHHKLGGYPQSQRNPNTNETESQKHSALSLKTNQPAAIKYEKYISEFVHTLLRNTVLNTGHVISVIDHWIAVLSIRPTSEAELQKCIDKLFKLFRNPLSMMQTHLTLSIKNVSLEFKKAMISYLLKEKNKITTLDSSMTPNKDIPNENLTQSETIIDIENDQTEQRKLLRRTIGVFSGHFHTISVNYNTVIFSEISCKARNFKSFYCLFVPCDVDFFPWDKWKENEAILGSDWNIRFKLFEGSIFNLPITKVNETHEFEKFIKEPSKNAACLLSFSSFYSFFQSMEKIQKVEPIITWKPIIFSGDAKPLKEDDPFYGLLMTVFGNRVYGLSYQKRVGLSFEFPGESRPYEALIFNNNVIFIPSFFLEEEDGLFQREIDNLIFGSESFETFLIKTSGHGDSDSILKVKIPIAASLPFRSDGTPHRVPNVLLKAKILNSTQIRDLSYCSLQILKNESFIVERKESLVTFRDTLKDHLKIPLTLNCISENQFRMLRKIRAVARASLSVKELYDVFIFYILPFNSRESSEHVFISNSEVENLGRNIDVMIASAGDSLLKLIEKSNFSCPVILARKDKTTWSMETNIKDQVRCLGRAITNSHSNRIWEAVSLKETFFTTLSDLNAAFSPSNPGSPYITSWQKLYAKGEREDFKEFHAGSIKPWKPRPPTPNVSTCSAVAMSDTNFLEKKKLIPKPQGEAPKKFKKVVPSPLKKRKVEEETVMETNEGTIPLKKRPFLVIKGVEELNDPTTPEVPVKTTIKEESQEIKEEPMPVKEDLKEPKIEYEISTDQQTNNKSNKKEQGLKVVIRTSDRIQAEKVLRDNAKVKPNEKDDTKPMEQQSLALEEEDEEEGNLIIQEEETPETENKSPTV